MNIVSRTWAIIAAAVVLASASSALATYIVGDDCSYPDGALSGNNGGSAAVGSSWSAAWDGSHSVSGGQIATDSGGFASREFSTGFNGSSTAPLYFSANFANNDTNNTAYALWLMVGSNASDGEGSHNATIGLADGKFSLRFRYVDDGDFGSYTAGEQVQVVGKLEFNVDGANSERLQIWVNPTGEETAAVVSSQIYSSSASNPDYQDLGWTSPSFVNIRNWGQGGGAGVIDNIKVGSTWADVASVPEPGTIALVATGLMGLLAYAWRKRK